MSEVTREGPRDDTADIAAPMWDGGRGPERRRDRRRKGRGRGGGEQPTVPEAEFRSYYDVPVVKAPPWNWAIPAYLFTGGLAGGSTLLALGGQLTGAPALRATGRITALAATLASGGLLIYDLGRPERFYMMLRVARPTSPMSMGTWILTAYGPMAGLAAAGEVAHLLPGNGRLGLLRRGLPVAGMVGAAGAAVMAAPLASYTGVLLADTAVPSWHEVYRELPFLFVGSALASAAGVGLLAAPTAQQGPARRMALVGAVVELAAERRVTRRYGLLSEPYETGKAGKLLRASQVLTATGAAGALLGRRNRAVAAASGVALLAGSLATRFGIFYGGDASARDPKYTVVPQRQRLREGRPARADSDGQVKIGTDAGVTQALPR